MTRTLAVIDHLKINQNKHNKIYPDIDMLQTGLKLKRLIESSNYTTKMIQEYLHLSCPQPIYRWYKGRILPSVDHLLMLSELLGVHMEELLVKKQDKEPMLYIQCWKKQDVTKHLKVYYEKLNISAA